MANQKKEHKARQGFDSKKIKEKTEINKLREYILINMRILKKLKKMQLKLVVYNIK